MKKVDLREIENKVKQGFDLSRSDFRGTDLRGINLRGARLDGSIFRYANLEGADLSYASIRDANLRHAVLRRANLTETDFTSSDLSHADLTGAIVIGTKLKNAKLYSVKGISRKVFFRASTLEKLMDQKRAEFRGELLYLVKERKSYKLIEAVRFVEVLEGSDDKRLLGKVKMTDELKKEGCEVMPGSVVCGETAYRVENGFLGIPEFKEAREGDKDETSDVEMLIEYFLKMESH